MAQHYEGVQSIVMLHYKGAERCQISRIKCYIKLEYLPTDKEEFVLFREMTEVLTVNGQQRHVTSFCSTLHRANTPEGTCKQIVIE